MKRLTYKNIEDKKYYPDMNVCSQFKGNYREAIHNKLGQLEDIESKLGIDLITLFKALKNGCFAKETFDYMGKVQTRIIFTEFTYFYYADDIDSYFIHIRSKDHYLKDYGKTWALTEEELKDN